MPTININGNVRVNTVANWTSDVTVYSAKTILISSDATYTGVDQRKFKIADGVQTWANLDYMPIDARALSEILDAGNQANQDIDMNSNSIQNVSFLGTGNSVIDMGGGSYIDITTDGGIHVTPNIFLDAVADTIDLNASSVMKNGNEVATESYVGSYSQPLDSDLTAIAGLTPTNDDILQRKSGAWTNRTPAQVSADLTANLMIGYQGIELIAQGLGISPADGTVYYIGSPFNIAPTTTADNRRIYVRKACTIKTADIGIVVAGVLGTGESSTIAIRVNNTTDTTISSAVTHSALYQQFSNTGLSISLSAGDYFEIKWTTPTWSTNPTNAQMTVMIYAE